MRVMASCRITDNVGILASVEAIMRNLQVNLQKCSGAVKKRLKKVSYFGIGAYQNEIFKREKGTHTKVVIVVTLMPVPTSHSRHINLLVRNSQG